MRKDKSNAMSCGFSGGKQVIKDSNARNRGSVYLFWTKENEELFILMTIMANMSRGSDHCFFSGCSSDHRCPYSEQLAILELCRELG